jgi:hypothetical protein
MGKRRAILWLVGGLALIGGGCQKQDVDRLSRLGSKVGQHVGTLTLGGNNQFMRGWRVAARISWDKELEGSGIQVQADGSTVTLSGKVADAAKRRRAVEIANATAGVEKVKDQMEGQ